MQDWGDRPAPDAAAPGEKRGVWLAALVLSSAVMLAAPLVVGCIWYLGRTAPPPAPRSRTLVLTEPTAHVTERIPPVVFTDVSDHAGLVFRHENGAQGEFLMPETVGGGCVFSDFDGDGDPDVLLVNSDDHLPGAPDEAPESNPISRLFRNDGRGRFADKSAGSGLDVTLYGMGAAVGDVDGDGLADVYLYALGQNRLFRNLGDFKFEDITEEAGVAGADGDWSTSCAFFDFDRDNDLDLFVGNYVSWSREEDLSLDRKFAGVLDYSRPTHWKGSFCRLYRNDGELRFTDVSAAAGIRVVRQETGYPAAKVLGLRPLDADGDGWQDIVVANDAVPQFLFLNGRDGTFAEVGTERGIAHDRNGVALNGMGIDVCHYQNDEQRVLGIANFFSKGMTAFRFDRAANQFDDVALNFGMVEATLPMTSFGLFFFDFDLDGREDLLLANGSTQAENAANLQGQRYRMPSQLFWSAGDGESPRFALVPEEICGSELRRPIIGRGAAYADIDGDGDLDVLIVENGGPARLFRNDQHTGHHWLRIKLVANGANPEAIGAAVKLQLGSQIMQRDVMPTRSYLSQVELPVTFGLGEAEDVNALWIIWPDGARQDVDVSELRIDSLNVIHQK